MFVNLHSSSCNRDKENQPSSERPRGLHSLRDNSPTDPRLQSSAIGNQTTTNSSTNNNSSISGGGGGSGVLGKRRSSESALQECGATSSSSHNDCNIKKQRVDRGVSVSDSDLCEQRETSDPVVDAMTSCVPDSYASGFNPPTETSHRGNGQFVVANGCSSTSNGQDLKIGDGYSSTGPATGGEAGSTTGCSQNSVARDIAAEFDSLFSPDVLLSLDNIPQLSVSSSSSHPLYTPPTPQCSELPTHNTVPVTTLANDCEHSSMTTSTHSLATNCHVENSAGGDGQIALGIANDHHATHNTLTNAGISQTASGHVENSTTSLLQTIDSSNSVGDSETQSLPRASPPSCRTNRRVPFSDGEHPLPHPPLSPPPPPQEKANEDNLMLGLFGGLSSSEIVGERDPTNVSSRGEGINSESRREDGVPQEEEEDLGLQRAMEESMKDQIRKESSDVVMLERLGLSEEEQLKLALELSMQEQCVDSPADYHQQQQQQQQCSVEPEETTTPEPNRSEAYKLMGIVNHIGRASSGGHYISDVYSVQEGVWRSYNDSYVSEAREEDIRQKRQGTGYIFFYMHKSILSNITSTSTKRTI